MCATGAGAVLDICCSYGINAALLNHDLTLEDLYDHYTSPTASAMTTSELAAWDREFYRDRRRPDAVPAFGLDAAPNAIAYACEVGLLDEGFGENLEAAPPSAALLRAARRIRLITVTGGASFLSSRTFRPLLESADVPVWVAALVLRTGSYRPIAECLDSFGLVTEKAGSRTFVQRRFTGPQERQFAVDAVTAAGEDPRGRRRTATSTLPSICPVPPGTRCRTRSPTSCGRPDPITAGPRPSSCRWVGAASPRSCG
ncbi:hypothetical protein NKH18_34795 [Streptomyces sp. M10(2022)]